ncbi:SDR family NAD(P)-dependent oxidoreductase [Pseudohalioglobus lutimaris]|uniref:KR domain-containing protein n=1 Tax=Pseudohalioglobus lutimaris TaxID=1737061 RepID=A0A2N5WYX0_9GAMM|nr:SDR family NAD(P)-dependent oxidoreductase [Pseudohalioglobus lutimaris]PLW67418.1 KR domain-containing protein [Pseudohalioglobus lutimaris]
MQLFANKVAVVTGAASGIGLGLARHCAREGMQLVLADRNAEQLLGVTDELRADGAKVVAVTTDVSDPRALDTLADAAYKAFGQVDLLINNAGVLISGLSWERPPEDWQWILNINLMGVVHGLHSFVPRMLEQDTPGHIVNVASLAGLLAAPLMGPYTVSKQAVVALTETLHYELASIDAKLKTSVVCPGPISTGIANSGTSRPVTSTVAREANSELMSFLETGIEEGMPPAECARIIFEGIRKEQFWIFTHDDFKDSYKARADSVIESTNPEYQIYVTQE